MQSTYCSGKSPHKMILHRINQSQVENFKTWLAECVKILHKLADSKSDDIDDQLLYHNYKLIEKTLWFFNDNVRFTHKKFRNLYTFSKELCPQIDNHCLKEYIRRYHQITATIPVSGAILISDKRSSVLMVRNNFSSTWSFPKGKQDPGETSWQTAVRECQEEIGFDISPYQEQAHHISFMHGAKPVHLYIIKDIPHNYRFRAQNRKEIKSIQWKIISDNIQHNKKYNKQISMAYPYLVEYLQSNNIPYRATIRSTQSDNCEL